VPDPRIARVSCRPHTLELAYRRVSVGVCVMSASLLRVVLALAVLGGSLPARSEGLQRLEPQRPAVTRQTTDTVPSPTTAPPPPSAPASPENKRNTMTDAAVIAAVILGSIAAYKAMGKPCACPSDTMKNGRSCGGNSAWSRGGGFKPLCFPTDITAGIIQAYRATGSIPRP
jgi:hypothetical protein